MGCGFRTTEKLVSVSCEGGAVGGGATRWMGSRFESFGRRMAGVIDGEVSGGDGGRDGGEILGVFLAGESESKANCSEEMCWSTGTVSGVAEREMGVFRRGGGGAAREGWRRMAVRPDRTVAAGAVVVAGCSTNAVPWASELASSVSRRGSRSRDTALWNAV